MTSDYVRWLRSHIGHQKTFLVRACGIVADGQGQLLLQQHLDFDLIYPNGDMVQQFTACFACRVIGGQWPPEAACFSPLALPDVPAWDRVMIEDCVANGPAASFRRGSPDAPTSREHILQLRRYVGHERLIMVGGAGLVRDDEGRILLIRRSDDAGGPTLSHTYPNGDQVEMVGTLFDCQVVGGVLRADNGEALEVRFFPPDRLPPLPERHLIRIRDGPAGREAASFQ